MKKLLSSLLIMSICASAQMVRADSLPSSAGSGKLMEAMFVKIACEACAGAGAGTTTIIPGGTYGGNTYGDWYGYHDVQFTIPTFTIPQWTITKTQCETVDALLATFPKVTNPQTGEEYTISCEAAADAKAQAKTNAQEKKSENSGSGSSK